MSQSDAFDPLRAALESAGIRFAVGGSWASSTFGEPRFTNDIDILADFTGQNLAAFINALPSAFYLDQEEANRAIDGARPFNVIHIPTTLKFDFFPAAAFPLGFQELDRAITLPNAGLSSLPVPFVSPEDILLAKLWWFKLGGENSTVQWRDILGILRSGTGHLDNTYVDQNAHLLGVADLLKRASSELDLYQ